MPNIIQSAAAPVSFIARKGNSFSVLMYFKDSDGNVLPGLAGATAEMKVVNSDGSTLLLFDTAPDLVLDTVLGTLALIKDVAQMDLVAGKYRYYLKFTYPSGLVVSYMVGSFYIKDEFEV